MAINPISLSRITQSLRTNYVTDSVRSNQLDVFQQQMRISSGRNFVTPGDDPAAAAQALVLNQALALQKQFSRNLDHADSVLAATDSAISEIDSLLIDAATIASQNLSNLTSADEREAEADLIAGIRDQLVTVGNRQFNGRYIFGGRETLDPPFIDALGGVAYVGDTGELTVRTDQGQVAEVNVPGNLLYGALSKQIATGVDLSANLSESTRIDSLTGAKGRGVRLGQLVVNEIGGAGVFRVDLTGSDTVGDIIEKINAAAQAAGSNLTASLGDTGIVVNPGGRQITLTDTSTGVVATDLGILIKEPTNTQTTGVDLGVKITPLTQVGDLASGTGIDTDSGLIITNGSEVATVDLSGAETVQDLLNRMNNAGVFIRAMINESGTGIDVFNQVSGVALYIGENGGNTAADLGIRTFDTETPIADLNQGDGVIRYDDGTDIKITAKDGTSFEVDLTGVVTIGDVIEEINAAALEAGIAVTAGFATLGNGLSITDATGGDGDLSVSAVNLSQAVYDLGLAKKTEGEETVLVGDDVNPMRTDGILDALSQLEQAMRADDTQAMEIAAQRLGELAEDVRRIHGIVGARAQSMQSKLQQQSDASFTTQELLSKVEDLDFADAITRLESAQLQYQADLQTSGRLLNLSLLDFLA